MSAVLQNWEVRNRDGLLTKVNYYEEFTLSGIILSKEFSFSSKEIKFFEDCFYYDDQEINLGQKSKLYKGFLEDRAIVLRLWSMFHFDGILYIEGYPYNSNERKSYAIQFPMGPFLYAQSGERILVDTESHESGKTIRKEDFWFGEAPDIFD